MTITQRLSIKIRKTTTARDSAASIDTMNMGLHCQLDIRHQGISASQNSASNVPTAFAYSEFHTSPWISSEKLVVIPHDGQG